MKKQLLVLLTALFIVSCSSDEQKSKVDADKVINQHQSDSKLNRVSIKDTNRILVKWKLDSHEIIGFKTAMDQVESSDIKVDLGHDKGMPKDELKKIFDGLKDEFKKTSYITTLKWNDRKNIEIKMFTENFNDKDKEPSRQGNFNPANMLKGVVLRGEVNEYGQVESFYLKSAQKNLIAMYFELPSKPIKLGDKWSLNINYLEFDQSFICKSADRINEVELIDILKDDTDTIVVFKYNISENANGYVVNPMNKEKNETSISIKYVGISEFSIVKGRWSKFNGIIETTQKGMMSGSVKQKLALIPFEKLTNEMKNIE